MGILISSTPRGGRHGEVAARWARGALLLALVALAGPEMAGAQDRAELSELGFVLGDPAAPLEIVEFADFACSACAEFVRDTWPAVRERYVETGRVRWRFIPFEIGFPNSEEGLRAAWCAVEGGAFWPMHDALYAERALWVRERRPEDPLVSIAGSVGLDPERFRDCYDDHPAEEEVERANRAARRFGVRGTPTFLVGDVVLQGAHPLESFRAAIESEGRGRPER